MAREHFEGKATTPLSSVWCMCAAGGRMCGWFVCASFHPSASGCLRAECPWQQAVPLLIMLVCKSLFTDTRIALAPGYG